MLGCRWIGISLFALLAMSTTTSWIASEFLRVDLQATLPDFLFALRGCFAVAAARATIRIRYNFDGSRFVHLEFRFWSFALRFGHWLFRRYWRFVRWVRVHWLVYPRLILVELTHGCCVTVDVTASTFDVIAACLEMPPETA
jgi:hypothetical protein